MARVTQHASYTTKRYILGGERRERYLGKGCITIISDLAYACKEGGRARERDIPSRG
jgi:hypothetical protein